MKDTKQLIIPLSEYEFMKRKIEDLEKSFDELESTKKYEELRKLLDLESKLRMASEMELHFLKRENISLKEQLKKNSSFNWW